MTSRDAPLGDLPPSNTPSDLPLGRAVDYPREYDPALLFPIARALGRGEIGLSDDALEQQPLAGSVLAFEAGVQGLPLPSFAG